MPGKGKPVTTITLNDLAPQSGQNISFTVNHAHNEKNIYKLWVSLKGLKNGDLLVNQYQPIEWPLGAGNEGTAEFTLGLVAEDYFAYVWRFPKSEDALRGAIVIFEV